MFWGMPYLLIKVAVVDSLPPVFVTWVRVVLGAVVLLVLAQRRGLLGTLRGRMRWLIVMASVEITLPFTLIAIGAGRGCHRRGADVRRSAGAALRSE